MTDSKSPWGDDINDGRADKAENKPKQQEDLRPEWGDSPIPFPKKSNQTKSQGGDPLADFVGKLEKLLEGRKSSNKGNSSGLGDNNSGFPINFKVKKKHFVVVGLIALMLWFSTGFYQVAPEEQGVVMRFGKFVSTTAPGLHYHLPYPIEEVLLPNVMRENRIEIGFRSNVGESRRIVSLSDAGNVRSVPQESLMLTGDENIVELNYTVTWKINEANKFLFNLRDPVGTVRMAAESAMREVVGQTPIQQVITGGREIIQEDTRKKLQAMMDEYGAGVQISAVQMLKVDPPSQVIDAFNDVQRAKADRERIRNEAEAYRNDIIPKARGEAEQIKQAAEAYREKVINMANGDASRFTSVLKEYKRAKDVTVKRMYLETMEKVLSDVNKIIVDPSEKGGNVLPYLPLSGLETGKMKGVQ